MEFEAVEWTVSYTNVLNFSRKYSIKRLLTVGIQKAIYCRMTAFIGIIAMISTSGVAYMLMKQLHENHYWFSQIMEVEREISFRTECGLYYSYYKQLVSASSFKLGLQELVQDNKTEHPSTINVIARMNIFQEIVLAGIYRSSATLQTLCQPIYFYIEALFVLHGLLVAALFLISWSLSSSWLSGLLTAILYICHKDDTVRIVNSLALRENFSLPFLWCQLFVINCHFKYNTTGCRQVFTYVCLTVTTFLFTVTWQFSQFVVLLQMMALFCLQVLGLVSYRKIFAVYAIQLLSLVAVFVIQFYNYMILCGPAISAILAAIIVMRVQIHRQTDDNRLLRRSLRVLCHVISMLLLTLAIRIIVKIFVDQQDDEHIYQFVLAKLGLITFNETGFSVQLYLCSGAFDFMTYDVIVRLSATYLLQFFVILQLVIFILLLVRWIHGQDVSCQWQTESTERIVIYAFHSVQALLFCGTAVTTVRMKYLWAPYACLLVGAALADTHLWRMIIQALRCQSIYLVQFSRGLVIIIYIGYLIQQNLPIVQKQLEVLEEFYDPDTVELMEWIKNNTHQSASFTGSMQLLAAVKLCTGRPITNHPHFENKHLREKTKQLYKIYGLYSADHVHAVMKQHQVDFVILEDSICLAPLRNGCRLTDLINNDSEKQNNAPSSLHTSRFCDEIRYNSTEYTKLYKLVFHNFTFRVYIVL